MRREDWRDDEAERLRRLRDGDRDDYGQADYSNTYGYDAQRRAGYRAFDDGRGEAYTPPRVYDERRDYEARDRIDERSVRRDARRGPSDRVLWAVIMERLEDERRLDLSDVDVDVRHGEVFLNGTVRHKSDKRRIEDVAEIDGVRNVQNNLRQRERRRWGFL